MAQDMDSKQYQDQLQALEHEIAATGRSAVAQARSDMAEATRLMDSAVDADVAYARADADASRAAAFGTRQEAKQARALAKRAKSAARSQHKLARKSAKDAYDAVRFTEPGNLGFLRLILAIFFLAIVFGIAGLVFIGKDGYDLPLDHVIDLLSLVFYAVSFWLIWQRKAVARWWVIGTSVFVIVVGSIVHIASGVFDPLSQVMASSFNIFLIVYFATSRRVRLTLDQPFSKETYERQIAEDESYWKPKTIGFWRNLAIYFAVFSVVGHWMEAAVCLLIKYGIVPGTYDPTSQIWSDWLYPFPVYGVGFVACALLFYPLKNYLQRKIHVRGGALAISYIVSCFVCTLIEFSMGMAVNQDLQLWDYSNMFGNFMGQVCLQNALFFGFAATVMTWIVYPALEKQFSRLSREAMTGVFVAVLVGFAILTALYLVDPPEAVIDEQSEADARIEQLQEERGLTHDQALSYDLDESLDVNPEVALAMDAFEESLRDYELSDDEVAQLREQFKLIGEYAQEHPDSTLTILSEEETSDASADAAA